MNFLFHLIYRFVLFPLFILLLIITGLFSAAIIYNTLISNANIGSFPDWIAAVASVTTTAIAWLAFKSAPHWLQQTMDERALNYMELLIEKHADLKLILPRMKQAKVSLISMLRNTDEWETSYELITNRLAELKNKIRDLSSTLEEIENIQEKLLLRGWRIKKEYAFVDNMVLDRILLINEFDNLYSTVLLTSIPLLGYSIDGGNEQQLRELIAEINKNSKKFDIAYKKCIATTSKILNLPRPIIDRFERRI